MRRKNLISFNQAGDTIVEVLIAIAVVSSVLGIAYSIMNQNLHTIRDNQERSEASKIAQGQLELLRVASSRADFAANTAPTYFCFVGSAATTNTVGNIADVSTYGSCTQSGIHRYFIEKNSSGGFTVTVRWDKIGGGTSEIVMAYRVD